MPDLFTSHFPAVSFIIIQLAFLAFMAGKFITALQEISRRLSKIEIKTDNNNCELHKQSLEHFNMRLSRIEHQLENIGQIYNDHHK